VSSSEVRSEVRQSASEVKTSRSMMTEREPYQNIVDVRKKQLKDEIDECMRKMTKQNY